MARLITAVALVSGVFIFIAATDAADWSITSQTDFGADGVIELDSVVVANWSATMDPIAGFSRSWYSASAEEGLFIGLAGKSDHSLHDADISLSINPLPGYTVSPMRWGQSSVPIHSVGGSLAFSGFTGAAQLLDDGSTGVGETDPAGPEIIDPVVGTSSDSQPFIVTRRDGDSIQNPDWVVETPFGAEPVTVKYTSQAAPLQVIANEAITVDVMVESVPEPAAAWLAVFAALGLMKLRRRT